MDWGVGLSIVGIEQVMGPVKGEEGLMERVTNGSNKI